MSDRYKMKLQGYLRRLYLLPDQLQITFLKHIHFEQTEETSDTDLGRLSPCSLHLFVDYLEARQDLWSHDPLHIKRQTHIYPKSSPVTLCIAHV